MDFGTNVFVKILIHESALTFGSPMADFDPTQNLRYELRVSELCWMVEWNCQQCYPLCHGVTSTVWKLSKYGILSDPYFPAFGLNTGKYGPENIPYLDTCRILLTCTNYKL